MATLCTVTTLDCPVEVLTTWVSYHLNIGVDHMFLFFDNPEHPGISSVAENARITPVRCDSEYWPGGSAKRERLTLHERQWFNANKALQWARERGFDWIAHIDSDELIYFDGNLKLGLDAIPNSVEVARLRVLEFIPRQLEYEHPFAGTHWFRVGPKRPARKARPSSVHEWILCLAEMASYYGRLGGAKLICPGARGPFLRGHTGGKSLVRVTADIKGMGVHLPAPPDGRFFRNYFLPRAAILHYDCGSFRYWMEKWMQRTSEKNVPRGRDAKRKRQAARFSATMKSEGLPGLYRLYFREYGLRDWEIRILSGLRLVRRIHVSSRIPPTGLA